MCLTCRKSTFSCLHGHLGTTHASLLVVFMPSQGKFAAGKGTHGPGVRNVMQH